jgi:hypothetical protein
MALLIVDEGSGVLEALNANPRGFKVSGILARLDDPSTAARLRRLLGFDAEAWRSFKQHISFYHNFSHASVFSLFYHVEPGEPDQLVIGAHFDPGKKAYTRKELTARRSALVSLGGIVRSVYRAVQPKRPVGPAA